MGMYYFMVIDLENGFWHLKLTEESSNLCQFSTPVGCFKFNHLPFGLKIAPELFQRVIQASFGNIDGVVVYFDDIMICTPTLEKHYQVLMEVLNRARELGVKFNSNKLQYRLQEVKYLGQCFSAKGVTPDPTHVADIPKIPSRTNKKEMQKTLGMFNYFREYIPNMALVTAPLRELIKNDSLGVVTNTRKEFGQIERIIV
jgi:hypothetical protein